MCTNEKAKQTNDVIILPQAQWKVRVNKTDSYYVT